MNLTIFYIILDLDKFSLNQGPLFLFWGLGFEPQTDHGIVLPIIPQTP